MQKSDEGDSVSDRYVYGSALGRCTILENHHPSNQVGANRRARVASCCGEGFTGNIVCMMGREMMSCLMLSLLHMRHLYHASTLMFVQYENFVGNHRNSIQRNI